MIIVTYVLSVAGIIAYIYALFNMGTNSGETLSDIGNGCMLTAILAMLFHIRNILLHKRNRDGQ